MNTEFENINLFENASLMLEVCWGAFDRNGYKTEARQLRGLEATSVPTAYASMMALESVQPRDGETTAARKHAIEALQAVVKTSLPLAS